MLARRHSGEIMYVFCAGMYRACSTWQYAVASQLVETHLQGRRLGYLSGDQFAAWDDALADDAGCYVLKSHDADERLAAALREGRALALYAYRDLRDVAY